MVLSQPINAQEKSICFSESDAGKIVVKLENYDKLQEEVDLLKQQNAELQKQIEAQKEIIKLKEDELTVVKQSVDEYKKLLDTQKQAYEKQISETKPSVIKQVFTVLGGIGLGILIGVFL